jgi:hypothetical protein
MLDLMYNLEGLKYEPGKETIQTQILNLQQELGLTSSVLNNTNNSSYVSKRKIGKQPKRVYNHVNQNTQNLPYIKGLTSKKNVKNNLLIAGIPIGSLGQKKSIQRTTSAKAKSSSKVKVKAKAKAKFNKLKQVRNEEMMVPDNFNWKSVKTNPSNIGYQIKRAN